MSMPPPPGPPTRAQPTATVPLTEPEMPDGEFADRLARVRAAMERQSLSALIVTDPANLYYLTGYNAWSFYVPQALIVPASGELQLYLRAMDARGAYYTSYLPQSQVFGYPESLVHRQNVHPFDWIADQAKESGTLIDAADFIIGIEGDAHYFPVRGYLSLAAALPAARLQDSASVVNWARVVKSDYEQHLLRIAGTITTNAMIKALASVAVGRRQCDVVAEIAGAQAHGTAQHGGDYPAIVPMLPTGLTAGTPHLTWSDSAFLAGEATTIELAGVFRRYHVPLARTVALGDPAPRLAALAPVITDAMSAALDVARPGVAARDVHAAFQAVIAPHGLVKESRIGYSIGIGYPPDWGERTVSLNADDDTELLPGMAFHVILGMWMDDWGYELSEPILLTDTGAERLTDIPQILTTRR